MRDGSCMSIRDVPVPRFRLARARRRSERAEAPLGMCAGWVNVKVDERGGGKEDSVEKRMSVGKGRGARDAACASKREST